MEPSPFIFHNIHINYRSRTHKYMSASIRQLREDKIIAYATLTGFVINLISIFYILLTYTYLPPLLPIYNHQPWGDERLGQKPELFLPLGLSFFLFICNIILAKNLYEKIPLIARMITITSFIIALITCIFIFKIIQITL